jgi:transposase
MPKQGSSTRTKVASRGKHLRPLAHLSAEQLQAQVHGAVSWRQRNYWIAIWLMSVPIDSRNGNYLSARQVASLTGLSKAWVRRLVREYNEKGARAFRPGFSRRTKEPRVSRERRGRKHLVDAHTRAILTNRIRAWKPGDRPAWTPHLVQSWVRDRVQVEISYDTALRYLVNARSDWKEVARDSRRSQPKLFPP